MKRNRKPAPSVLRLCGRARRGAIAGAALAALLCAAGQAAAATLPLFPVDTALTGDATTRAVTPVVDRLEMRSYQPYSTLQYGFRPSPPVQRGVKRTRPEIVMPTPRAPLIEYGRPSPYSALWYAYCAEKFHSFEPATGLYTTRSGGKRVCR